MKYNIETVSFDGCGVPIDMNEQIHENVTITRYNFGPNLLNTWFPMFKGKNCVTLYLKQFDPTILHKSMLTSSYGEYRKLQKAEMNLNRLVYRQGAEGISHGLTHFSTHSAEHAVKKLIKQPAIQHYQWLIPFASKYMPLLLFFIFVACSEIKFQAEYHHLKPDEINKILRELILRSQAGNLEELLLTMHRDFIPVIVEGDWPNILACMNVIYRAHLNALVEYTEFPEKQLTEVSQREHILSPSS